jgi:hypothetical protein
MPDSTVGRFTDDLVSLLRTAFAQVTPEWRTQFEPGIYSPRVDIAVGPFAIEHGRREARAYDLLCRDYDQLLHALIQSHRSNCSDPRSTADICDALRSFNRNSRCFIAIEIENSVGQKHLLGGALNAAVLGRIGVAIGWRQASLDMFLRLRRYFLYLRSVGKNTFDASNLLVLSPKQLRDSVCAFINQRSYTMELTAGRDPGSA